VIRGINARAGGGEIGFNASAHLLILVLGEQSARDSRLIGYHDHWHVCRIATREGVGNTGDQSDTLRV
jgi:hypothetical protein